MEIDTKPIHNVCSALILFNLEDSPNNGNNIGWREVDKRKEHGAITVSDLYRTLITMKAQGYGIAMAVTDDYQRNAERALRKAGFKTQQKRFTSEKHDTTTRLWYYPVQKLDTVKAKEYIKGQEKLERSFKEA